MASTFVMNSHPVIRQRSVRAQLRYLALGLIALAVQFDQPVAGQIHSDERVVFFPTASYLSDDAKVWNVPIHGWIFEPEKGDILRDQAVRSLQRTLRLTARDEMSEIFDSRTRLFLVDNERGKTIRVRFGKETFAMKPSDRDGHFMGTIQLSLEAAEELERDGLLTYQAETDSADSRSFVGISILVPNRGVSVISDVDDTVKVSDVIDTRKLLENTFLRPFQPVEGMAHVYRQWNNEGALIHYVSSSPWQLYETLAEYLRRSEFPHATFHLKRFRIKDSSWMDLLADPLVTKPAIIEPLMATYPQRKFVLVGDSGESDPEVYGAIARKHLAQISQIYIRDVTDEKPDSNRYQQAFHDIPRDRWHLFTNPADLKLPHTAE